MKIWPNTILWESVVRTVKHKANMRPCFGKKIALLESWETRWLSETPNQAGSVGWDAALPRICPAHGNETGEQYLVGSAHL